MSDDRSREYLYDERTRRLERFYDESDIRLYLADLNAGESLFTALALREIDRILFDNRIGFANLSRYIRGDPIVNREHRRLLLIRSDDRNRIVINADDPESAAITILTARKASGEYRASDEYLARLAALLQGVK